MYQYVARYAKRSVNTFKVGAKEVGIYLVITSQTSKNTRKTGNSRGMGGSEGFCSSNLKVKVGILCCGIRDIKLFFEKISMK